MKKYQEKEVLTATATNADTPCNVLTVAANRVSLKKELSFQLYLYQINHKAQNQQQYKIVGGEDGEVTVAGTFDRLNHRIFRTVQLK